MRGSPGRDLVSYVPLAYQLNKVDRLIAPLIAQGLLEDGNLVYAEVHFDSLGMVRRSPLDGEVSGM